MIYNFAFDYIEFFAAFHYQLSRNIDFARAQNEHSPMNTATNNGRKERLKKRMANKTQIMSNDICAAIYL